MLSPEDSAWEETPQPLFSPRSAGPTVQRLVLGGHLRRLREEAGMTTEQAAASIRGSHSKISRMEHGRVGFKERDIADLLTLYTGSSRTSALRPPPPSSASTSCSSFPACCRSRITPAR
jgi:hypothetical protein